MFIAGHLLPIFVFIYFFFFIVSLMISVESYIPERMNYKFNILIFGEFFFLLYMIHFAGTIMLSMLHHRKVNKSILYILLVCYFSPIPFPIISFLKERLFLLHIPNIVIHLAIFGFGVFFYCKYANQVYPNSEFLDPSDLNEK